MPDVSVRTAGPDDAETILAVKRTAITELAAHAYTPAQLDAWAPEDDHVESYRSAIDAETFQVLLAEDDQRVVGYGVLNAEAASIEALFVRPFWTRSGVATRLLRQLETSAAFANCGTLSVVSSLNAVPFYESVGYDPVERRHRTIDDVDIEFVLLRKDLTLESWDADTT